MKAVLISIQPKWCELIASGKKTVEVRKTRPKIETPFKCYIYETMAQFIKFVKGARTSYGYGRGKVIGEFVCDKVYDITPIQPFPFGGALDYAFQFEFEKTALTVKEFKDYLDGNSGYGWHISELKIYDKPKELGEFKPWCEESRKTDDNLEICCNCKNAFSDEDGIFFGCGVTRPPQSWCYVEDMSE